MAFRNTKFTNLLLQKQLFISEYNDILIKKYDNNSKNIELYKKLNFSSNDKIFIENYYYNSMINPSVYNKDIDKNRIPYLDAITDNILINYKINIGKIILHELR